MERALLDRILCPLCGSGEWNLEVFARQTIGYTNGPREEVQAGRVTCAEGHTFPVDEFVLSFDACFPEDLKREARYWTQFYLWHRKYGGEGLHDLRKGYAPFVANGVPEPFPFADTIERYDVHNYVSEHPLLRKGRSLLDMGVGLGWTSIHFARAGYEVTAFDPSLGTVQAAKAYAISQGIFIEYVCAAVGYLQFREGSFDNVTAFHSLHHVPDLTAGLSNVQRWLKPGGALAVDEHIVNSELAHALSAQIYRWAEDEVLPHYRTLSPDDMAGLPVEPHSALEDAGIDQVAPLLRSMFNVQHEKMRHTFLDHYPLLYYLWKEKELSAYTNALEIANQVQEFVRLVDPQGGEYITLVATNEPPTPGLASTQAEVPAAPPEQAAVEPAPGPDENDAHAAQVADLTARLAAQSEWAHSLEQAQIERDREIARLRAHIRRVENGRVMRLLNALTRRPGKSPRT